MVLSSSSKIYVKAQDLCNPLTKQMQTSKLPSTSGKKTVNSGATCTW